MEATFQSTAQSEEAQQHELEKFTTNFSTLLGQLKPKKPEADVFEALRAAALATPNGGTIVLIDSGIPTKGQLSFLDGDLFTAAQKPDDVTGYLNTNHLLPDLSGRSVVLVDVGQTADPQAGLNEDLPTRVVSLWDHVAHSAGAAAPEVEERPAGSVDTGGIAVTPVPCPRRRLQAVSATVFSDGGPVGFQGDVAVFRNESAARAALQPLADEAKNGEHVGTLVGTTASARTKSFRDQLSKDRAEAVKQILVEQGVDPAGSRRSGGQRVEVPGPDRSERGCSPAPLREPEGGRPAELNGTSERAALPRAAGRQLRAGRTPRRSQLAPGELQRQSVSERVPSRPSELLLSAPRRKVPLIPRERLDPGRAAGSTPTIACLRDTLPWSAKRFGYRPSRPSCTDSPGASLTVPVSQVNSSRGGTSSSGQFGQRVLSGVGDASKLQHVRVPAPLRAPQTLRPGAAAAVSAVRRGAVTNGRRVEPRSMWWTGHRNSGSSNWGPSHRAGGSTSSRGSPPDAVEHR